MRVIKWLVPLVLIAFVIAIWSVVGPKPPASDAGAKSPGSDVGPKPPGSAQSFVITATTATATTMNCPDGKTLLQPSQSDREQLIALVPKIVEQLYTDPGHQGYTIGEVRLAPEAGVRGEMVAHWCGPEVASRTWLVGLTFPNLAPSASLSSGLFWVSRTEQGWNVWYRYR